MFAAGINKRCWQTVNPMARRAMNLPCLLAMPQENLGGGDVTGLGPATGKGLMEIDSESTLCFEGCSISSRFVLISLK